MRCIINEKTDVSFLPAVFPAALHPDAPGADCGVRPAGERGEGRVTPTYLDTPGATQGDNGLTLRADRGVAERGAEPRVENGAKLH